MDIVTYILKCIAVYLVVAIIVRLIGVKSVSAMSGYDFVGVLLIALVAAQPIVNKDITLAALGAFTIAITTILVGYLTISKLFYRIDSKPSVLVSKGKIIEKNLKSSKMNIEMLTSELRIKGYQNLSHIEYAILEPNGSLSVIADSQESPATPSVMGIPSSPVKLVLPVIIDGMVEDDNLIYLQKDKKWLKEQLSAFNVNKFSEVLLCQYDEASGRFFVNLKNKEEETPNIL